MAKLLSVEMRPTDELNDRTPIRERQRRLIESDERRRVRCGDADCREAA